MITARRTGTVMPLGSRSQVLTTSRFYRSNAGRGLRAALTPWPLVLLVLRRAAYYITIRWQLDLLHCTQPPAASILNAAASSDADARHGRRR